MTDIITLKNDLVLEIWDYSRKLAGDRWLVGFLAQIGITPSKEDFSNSLYYQHFMKNTDGKLYYRYYKERTFVPEEEVNRVFSEIKENFLKAVMPYISSPDFPASLLKREVALYERKVDWELYREAKEREEKELEEFYKDRKVL
ncbi:MAG: hypothetical protein N2Z40_07600 [Caldimicrobium sp.]|nr:hypothetical protein [Caldimicrobium sp.]MCX7614060.1 hypothetical protein [Caldimicrobium sp.]MDW8182861.1 hypothetical protein [Caldimicrobium sp.]